MGSAIYICTPSLNSEETIEKTINSVINQSANFEVYYIVKDSGSTDGTISILKRIEKKISENRDEYKNVKFSFESSYDEGIYDSITKGFDFFFWS
ncbi:glycosyltransferase [Vibrio parahaemolyticus]|nr:glycosyltransferase [Vibrio parahaemolyticus]